jgi:hypothetical protein
MSKYVTKGGEIDLGGPLKDLLDDSEVSFLCCV